MPLTEYRRTMDSDTLCGEVAVGATMAEEVGAAEEAEEAVVEEGEVVEEGVAGEGAVVVRNKEWLPQDKQTIWWMTRSDSGLLTNGPRISFFPRYSHPWGLNVL